jgi:hypothetical protein
MSCLVSVLGALTECTLSVPTPDSKLVVPLTHTW